MVGKLRARQRPSRQVPIHARNHPQHNLLGHVDQSACQGDILSPSCIEATLCREAATLSGMAGTEKPWFVSNILIATMRELGATVITHHGAAFKHSSRVVSFTYPVPWPRMSCAPSREGCARGGNALLDHGPGII